MRALVEGGADVRAVDDQGLSALLNAVKVGALSSRLNGYATLERIVRHTYATTLERAVIKPLWTTTPVSGQGDPNTRIRTNHVHQPMGSEETLH